MASENFETTAKREFLDHILYSKLRSQMSRDFMTNRSVPVFVNEAVVELLELGNVLLDTRA